MVLLKDGTYKARICLSPFSIRSEVDFGWLKTNVWFFWKMALLKLESISFSPIFNLPHNPISTPTAIFFFFWWSSRKPNGPSPSPPPPLWTLCFTALGPAKMYKLRSGRFLHVAYPLVCSPSGGMELSLGWACLYKFTQRVHLLTDFIGS